MLKDLEYGKAGGRAMQLDLYLPEKAKLEGGVNDLKASSRLQAIAEWFGPTDFLRIGDAESDLRHTAPDSPESKLVGGSLLDNKDRAAKKCHSARLCSNWAFLTCCSNPATVVLNAPWAAMNNQQLLPIYD